MPASKTQISPIRRDHGVLGPGWPNESVGQLTRVRRHDVDGPFESHEDQLCPCRREPRLASVATCLEAIHFDGRSRAKVNQPVTDKRVLGRRLNGSRLVPCFQGRDFRLTDVHGEVVKGLLA